MSRKESERLLQVPVDEFTVNFLRKVSETKEDENILVSPIGILIIYTMLLEGARGATADQFVSVFHLEPSLNDVEKIREELKKLTELFHRSEKNLSLKMVNKLVFNQTRTLKASYMEILEQNYQLSVDQEDFGKTDDLMVKLNGWISKETNNLIPELFEKPFNQNDIMVLINVLYFKGLWQTPFTEAKTTDGVFNNIDGTKSTVKMMYSSKPKYPSSNRDEENLRIIKLPYIGTIAMFIVMPTGIDGLRELLMNLTAEKIENYVTHNWLAHFPSVRIPKFRLENTHDLCAILSSIGLNLPFTDSAEFTGISDDPLKISESIQKTFINVDEKGTEAVAAATTRTRIGCMRRMQMDAFVLDRPFMFFLRDRQTRVNLFVGVVKNLPDAQPE